jgi:hypothetical protein
VQEDPAYELQVALHRVQSEVGVPSAR